MCNTFSTRFGPSPVSELIAELQHKHHATIELMYYAAAQHLGFRGPDIPTFSEFRDMMGYSGRPASVQYLKAMFVDWVTAHRVFIERIQSSLPADVMKVDHTFDVSFLSAFNSQFHNSSRS